MKRITAVLAVTAIFIVSACGQSFQNLNFESAYNLTNPPEPDGADFPVTEALPGWTAYDGDVPLGDINYVSNELFAAGTAVELEGGSLALDGDFSVGLYSISSISQTGLVPDNAESLEFEANPALNLVVTLGGQSLSFRALSQGPNYTIYGANIPAGLDGQLEALTFGTEGAGGLALLDDIEFLPTTVPEPAEWALIGVAVVSFVLWRRRRNLAGPGCSTPIGHRWKLATRP